MSDKKTGDILYAAEFNAKTDKTYVDTELAKKQDIIGSYSEIIQGLKLYDDIKTIQSAGDFTISSPSGKLELISLFNLVLSTLSSANIKLESGNDITADTLHYTMAWDTDNEAIRITFK